MRKFINWGVFLAAWAAMPAEAGSGFEVLHTFGRGTDGASPVVGLAADGAGNYFGITEFGGVHGDGTVYELSPDGNSGWTYRDIHDFTYDSGTAYPLSAVLIGAHGEIYGTSAGGSGYNGAVYALRSAHDRGYKLVRSYLFKGEPDAAQPFGSLVMDGNGHLLGASNGGGKGNGTSGFGTLYNVDAEGASWHDRVLFRFNDEKSGYESQSGLTLGPDGAFYGVASGGGSYGYGTAFRLARVGHRWRYQAIYEFADTGDGAYPFGTPVFGHDGTMYLTTTYPFGTVVALSPPGKGASWKETTLYTFTGGADGAGPYAGLTLDAHGDLYGTAINGGSYAGPCSQYGCGVVFKLTKAVSAPWPETVLWTFTGGEDGSWPQSRLVPGPDGGFLGTDVYGGAGNQGVVFSVHK